MLSIVQNYIWGLGGGGAVQFKSTVFNFDDKNFKFSNIHIHVFSLINDYGYACTKEKQ